MKIGIIGAGTIGSLLVQKLSKAGHDVKVAAKNGPESIDRDVLSQGGRAVTSEEAVTNVDAIIVSIPPNSMPDVAYLFADIAADTVVIETSNYFPQRDGNITALDDGIPASVWVSEQLGRPVAKAWNTMATKSFAVNSRPAGAEDRLAMPVAADRDRDRLVAMGLVEDSGFDAVDAGPLSESWRQQPGSPVYCTDLTRDEIPTALSAAERDRLPKRRDLTFAVAMEWLEGTSEISPPAQVTVRQHRALLMNGSATASNDFFTKFH